MIYIGFIYKTVKPSHLQKLPMIQKKKKTA